MRHYLLFYQFADDYAARRTNLRQAHLTLAWQASEQGILKLAGALDEPVDQGVLLFHCDSQQQVEAFAEADPYVTQGLVSQWHIRPWITVLGDTASQPLYPA